MILPTTNPISKCFVYDLLPDICLANYEADIDVPRIIVGNKKKRPTVYKQTFGDHFIVEPCALKSELQFDCLAIDAIIQAHKVFNNTFDNINDVNNYFDRWDIPRPVRAIISEDRNPYSCNLNPIRHEVQFIRYKRLKNDECYFITEPEFFGVLVAKNIDGNNFHYGIGIANTKGIVKMNVK